MWFIPISQLKKTKCLWRVYLIFLFKLLSCLEHALTYSWKWQSLAVPTIFCSVYTTHLFSVRDTCSASEWVCLFNCFSPSLLFNYTTLLIILSEFCLWKHCLAPVAAISLQGTSHGFTEKVDGKAFACVIKEQMRSWEIKLILTFHTSQELWQSLLLLALGFFLGFQFRVEWKVYSHFTKNIMISIIPFMWLLRGFWSINTKWSSSRGIL